MLPAESRTPLSGMALGFVMCNTDDDAQQETEQIRFLTSRMVDGIVFVRALKRSNMDQLFDSGLPRCHC